MIKTNWNSEKITPETFLEKIEKTSDKPTGGETYLGITEDGRICIIAVSGEIDGVLRTVKLIVSKSFQKCKCDATDMSYGEFLEHKPRQIEMEEGGYDRLALLLMRVALDGGGWVSLNYQEQEFIKKLKSSLK